MFYRMLKKAWEYASLFLYSGSKASGSETPLIRDAYLILTHPSTLYDKKMSARDAMQTLANSFDKDKIIEVFAHRSYIRHRGRKVKNLDGKVLDELMDAGVFVCCGGYWDSCHKGYTYNVLVTEALKRQKDVELVFPMDGIYHDSQRNLSEVCTGSEKSLREFKERYSEVAVMEKDLDQFECTCSDVSVRYGSGNNFLIFRPRLEAFAGNGENPMTINGDSNDGIWKKEHGCKEKHATHDDSRKPVITVRLFHDVRHTLAYLYENR